MNKKNCRLCDIPVNYNNCWITMGTPCETQEQFEQRLESQKRAYKKFLDNKRNK